MFTHPFRLLRLLLESRTHWVERMVEADERLAQRRAPASVRFH